MQTTYSANITAGALRVRECRMLAPLVAQGASAEEWDHQVIEDNILQSANPASARRLGRLLRQRLELLPPDALMLVQEGTHDEAVQAMLAAAILHSPLLRDFMDLVLRDHYRLFAEVLPKYTWDPFLEQCAARDPDVLTWSDKTREKVRQVCFTILVDAGYLSDTRELRLQTVRVLSSVRHGLLDTPAATAIPTMEACP